MPDEGNLDLLSILLSLAAIIVTAVVSYYFGRKSKFDEIRIQRGFVVAESILSLFEVVAELEELLYKWYQINFVIAEGGLPVDVDEAVDRLERRAGQYQEQYDHIKELQEKKVLLFDELRGARLYLDAQTIGKIQEYLELGEVEYITNGGIMIDTFLLEFFRNLSHEKNHQKRIKLSRAILKRAQKFVR